MDLVPAVVAALRRPGFSGVFPGGVYDRGIKAKGRGATPAAFDGAEILVCASVTGSTTADPFGPSESATGSVTVWVRGPETEVGRAAVRAAVQSIISGLAGMRLTGPDGTGAVLSVGDRLGLQVDPNIDNVVLDYVRFGAAGFWRMP